MSQAFVGHTAPTVTGAYLQASLVDLATVSVVTGEQHPPAGPSTSTPDRLRCRRR